MRHAGAGVEVGIIMPHGIIHGMAGTTPGVTVGDGAVGAAGEGDSVGGGGIVGATAVGTIGEVGIVGVGGDGTAGAGTLMFGFITSLATVQVLEGIDSIK
jgi:hypothetical protein